MRKNNNYISLTTRLPAKTFLAITKLASDSRKTESAYLRDLLLGNSSISEVEVTGDEVEQFMLTIRRRTKKSRKSWIKRIFGK